MNRPVAPAGTRELLHKRSFEFAGYLRADGLYEIEGRMTDRKSYAFPNDWRGEIAADEPLHDMRVKVTLDDAFEVIDVVAETAASPYEVCPAVTPSFAALRGARIGRGWTALLTEKFGGVRGCTHHVELLRSLATVAFQTIYGEQQRRRRESGTQPPVEKHASGKRPGFIDTCHALAADGEIVRAGWPEFYRPKG